MFVFIARESSSTNTPSYLCVCLFERVENTEDFGKQSHEVPHTAQNGRTQNVTQKDIVIWLELQLSIRRA
jgi:hypothetical protein